MERSLDVLFVDKLSVLCGVTCNESQCPNLLRCAQRSLGLGFLVAFDQLLRSPIRHSIIQSVYSAELANLCVELCDRCLRIMGCQSWITVSGRPVSKGACSFRELGQSIQRIITIAQKEQSSDPGEDFAGVDISSSLLLPEYQHLLSWAWNTLRLSANILSRWAIFHSKQTETTAEDWDLCSSIGHLLVHILLHCRHRGTVESVCSSLQLYLSAASIRRYPPNDRTRAGLLSCEEVLELSWNVLCRCEYSVTRRAAGLWPAIKAPLLVERSMCSGDMPHLLAVWIDRLMTLAQSVQQLRPPGREDELTDSPRVLAIHLLRGIFADARLKPHTCIVREHKENLVVDLLQSVIIPSFSDPDWAVYNAALQLHSTLIHRLIGGASDRLPPTGFEVFNKHSPLLNVCLRELRCIVQHSEVNRSTSRLIPILTLLARLYPSFTDDDPTFCEMRAVLYGLLLSHQSAPVRQLAADAFLVFVPLGTTDLSKFGVTDPFHPFGHGLSSPASYYQLAANSLHGQFYLLRAWFEQPVSSGLLKRRKAFFNWSDAIACLKSLLLGELASIPCALFLAGHLCVLLTRAYDAEDVDIASLRLFQDWLNENAGDLFGLSNEPFRIEAVRGLHLLTNRLFKGLSFVDFTITPASDPEHIGRFLSSEVEHELKHFLPALLRYWIEYPDNLYFVCPLLCWRIVDTWATTLCKEQLSVALDTRVLGNAIGVLRRFSSSDVCGSDDSVNKSRLVLCSSSGLIHTPNMISDYLNWWVEQTSYCLSPNCPEVARQNAAEALRLVLVQPVSNRTWFLDHATLADRRKLLKTLFFGLFDESPVVRNRISRIVSQCLSLTENTRGTSHLLSALSVLDELSRLWLTTNRVDWIFDLLSDIMLSLNRRIIEDEAMRNRSVLYEREADNDLCEPRLLIELIMMQLDSDPDSSIQEHSLRFKHLIEDSSTHLARSASEHQVSVEQCLRQFTESVDFHTLSPAEFARNLAMKWFTQYAVGAS